MPDKPWAPGLIHRPRKGGPIYYWLASNCHPKCPGYPVRTVRLDPDFDEEARAQACRKYYGEMMIWKAGQIEPEVPPLRFKGNVISLLDQYELHEESPFHAVKHTTKKRYLNGMKVLKNSVGHRQLRSLTGPDFIRWHKKLLVGPNDRRLVAKAHEVMAIFRRAIKWGVVLELPHCVRLNTILMELRFEQSKPRTIFMTYEQCQAIIAKAHEIGRPSIALTQALQFDLTMRRIDCIGEWVPDEEGRDVALADHLHHQPVWVRRPAPGLYLTSKNVKKLQRWATGLTWNHITPSHFRENWILDKEASKTAHSTRARIQFDLKSYPMVLQELERIPQDRRVGPVVLNEATRLPYTAMAFSKLWRRIATAAGVPLDVWNMDSRAGGITEGSDAGANLESLRHHAGHRNQQMTARYSRQTLEKTNQVAHLRIKKREEPQV